jgi:hypothetical protein
VALMLSAAQRALFRIYFEFSAGDMPRFVGK